VEDYNQVADFVRIFSCEQKIIKYAILKLFRFAKFKLINFFLNSNANALFMNGSVPRLFVLTYGISYWCYLGDDSSCKDLLSSRKI